MGEEERSEICAELRAGLRGAYTRMVKKAKKMSVTSIAAWPIFTHAIITPARTSESIDAPNAVYSPRRCFTITADGKLGIGAQP